MSKAFGFNVIGHVSGNLGLGVSARNVIQLLLDNDFPVAILDIDPGIGRGKYDLRFEALTVQTATELPYAVNLLIFGLPSFVPVLAQYRPLLVNPDHFNVAFIWWELGVIPPKWRPVLEFFDVLVAPSRFIRHTLDVALPRTMTIGAKQPLYLPDSVPQDRYRFGLDSDALVYVTSFELASDAKRKNVIGVVEAFKRGLAQVPAARLILKLNNAAGVPMEDRVLNPVLEAISRDPRIRLLTEALDYQAVLRLYASSDVFVSLHRSEGLGLGPMEAMALGKPCIATAWSGNMDYMDHTNAALVPYTLVPVTGGTRAYSASALSGAAAQWADPDIDEASAWMRRLANDSAIRLALGGRAANAIARFQEEANNASFAHEIKALWEHRLYLGPVSNLESRINALESASSAVGRSNTTAMAKFGRTALQALDRHILWRFRNS